MGMLGSKAAAESGADGKRSMMTLGEVQLMKELFQKIGVRGTVTEKQLASLLEMLGVEAVRSDLLFDMFDVNKDGRVAPKEVIEVITLFLYGTFDELVRFLFNFYDTNGDGTIDFRELDSLFEVLEELNAVLATKPFEASSSVSSAEATEDVMKRHDSNGDGLIDFEEFEKLVEENSMIHKWTETVARRTRVRMDSLRLENEDRLVMLELERLLEDELDAQLVQRASVDTAALSSMDRKKKYMDKGQSQSKQVLADTEEIDKSDAIALEALHHETELQKFQIKYDSIQFGEHIGSGAHADVVAGEWLNLPVAVKVIKHEVSAQLLACAASGEAPSPEAESLCRIFESEMTVLANLRHPNVMLYLGAVLEPGKPMCIVSEFMSGGSLHHLLRDGTENGAVRSLGAAKRLKLALDVCRGVLYLHSREPAVLHRDLKSENVLVGGESGRAVVADFGLSITVNNPEASDAIETGTAATMAPEVVDGEPYTTASDVYSVAIVLWELMTGRLPYEDMRAPTILFKVSMDDLRPEFMPDDDVSGSMRALIESMWAADPADRPGMAEVVPQIKTEMQMTI